MDRRAFLTSLVAVSGAIGGCGAYSTAPGDGPDPEVIEHVRGNVTVTETRQVFEVGGSERIEATVQNSGIDARVTLSLYWVPEVGLDPAGKSHEQLREMGYELVTRRAFGLGEDERRTLTFDAAMPDDVAGYYVRKYNHTYGAVVENRGDPGQVEASLVDTTDMDDQRVLATRTVTMNSRERRVIALHTDDRFEMFRVDVRGVS